MELKELTEEELEDLLAQGGTKHRGRVSYPIIKMFMESESKASILNIEHKNKQILAQVLRSYVKNHEHPVSVLVKNKEVILVRTDMGGETGEKATPEITPDAPIDITEDDGSLDETIEEQGKMVFKKKVT